VGLPVGPDAFGLRQRGVWFSYSRHARSSLLGSLQNHLGQLYGVCRDGPWEIVNAARVINLRVHETITSQNSRQNLCQIGPL
jgi:hypothetical protein